MEDCVISRNNHLTRGDQSRGAKFQNGCIAFCQCCAEVVNVIRGNSTAKSTKDAIKFGGTLPKKIDVFYQPKFFTCLDRSNYLYLQNLLQNPRAPEQLYKYFNSPQAQ